MIKYLCLDNALATTGWAIYEDKNLLKWNKFNTKAIDSIEIRLAKIYDFLGKMLNKYNFDILIFEDCQSQSNRNIQTYHKLSMVKAIILYWCAVNHKDYSILSPSHWRSILKEKRGVTFGRNRIQQKAAAKDFVKKEFNIDATEDECDAICLGLAGIIEKDNNRSAF